MKIHIDLDKVGEPLSVHIQRTLQKQSLPTCLGSMCPPILDSIAIFELSEVGELADGLPKSNIVESDIRQVIPDGLKEEENRILRSYALGVNGVAKISDRKVMISTQYAEKLKRCAKPCEYLNLCDKLTTHYLNTLKIVGGNQC